MKRSILILAIFLVCFAVHSAHADFNIDFETLSDGITVPTAGNSASTEYASLGVTFAGGGIAGQPVFYEYSDLNPLIADPPPADNKWFIFDVSKIPGPGTFFYIDILFSDDVFEASGDVIINPSFSVTATAFDSSDNVLATSVIPAGSSAWIAGSFNFISSTPIARINLLPSSENAAVGLDNFQTPTFSGWVFMPQGAPDLGYSLDEEDLVYFYSFDFVQSFNLATGGWFSHMPMGWVYFEWPFYYESDLGSLWFALPPPGGIGLYHNSTGQWEVLPRIIP
ncbi:MAG: hypothetical protein ACYS6K_15255 [Planctomycetota bacterium]|jgi:hypothetical protein